MGLLDYLILGVVLLWLGYVLYQQYRQRKAGQSRCSGCQGHCQHCALYTPDKQEKPTPKKG